jgi:hypothetical protein
MELPHDAQRQRQIRRADEEQVHAVQRGDPVGRVHRRRAFDLDCDKLVAVGVRGELGGRLVAVVSVPPARIDAAAPTRSEQSISFARAARASVTIWS